MNAFSLGAPPLSTKYLSSTMPITGAAQISANAPIASDITQDAPPPIPPNIPPMAAQLCLLWAPPVASMISVTSPVSFTCLLQYQQQLIATQNDFLVPTLQTMQKSLQQTSLATIKIMIPTIPFPKWEGMRSSLLNFNALLQTC